MPAGEETSDGTVRIAVGVLRRPDGQVLIAQRPHGKEMAGAWEFPGGKFEAGESVTQALARELREELGIEPGRARRLIRLRHSYPHRTVELDTWIVSAWSGEPRACERQALAWSHPDGLADYALLPADGPIVTALRLPAVYVMTPPSIETAVLRARLPTLPAGALLRLRRPDLDAPAYRRLAEVLVADCHALGLGLMLDRDPRWSAALGAGWHAREAALRATRTRPLPAGLTAIASCHGAESLALARARGFDAAVLGPVLPTRSHPGAPGLGWSRFESLAAAAGLPVYAIGGLDAAQVDMAWAAGAQGVAGIGAWWRDAG